jgi:hypothetical protein
MLRKLSGTAAFSSLSMGTQQTVRPKQRRISRRFLMKSVAIGVFSIAGLFSKESRYWFRHSDGDEIRKERTPRVSAEFSNLTGRALYDTIAALPSDTLPLGDKPLPRLFLESQTPSNNRTLVILTGDLRCGEKAWSTLYENVLDLNHADLALFVQVPSQLEYKNASLFARARHIEWIPRYDDWADAIDLIDGPAWRETILQLYPAETHYSILGGVEGYKASAAIVHMFRYFVAERIKRNGWEQQYDRFIVTRTDQFYKCPIDLSKLDPESLWLAEGEDFGGYNDRFYVAPSSLIRKTLEVMPTFVRKPYIFQNVTHGPSLNSERVLYLLWRELGLVPSVKRFVRTFFTCSMPMDSARWSKGIRMVEEGVFFKYRREYADASDVSCG